MTPDPSEIIYNEIQYLRKIQADQAQTLALMNTHVAVVNQILEDNQKTRIHCSGSRDKNTKDIAQINIGLEKINEIMNSLVDRVAAHQKHIDRVELEAENSNGFWDKAKDYSGKVALILVSAAVTLLIKTYLG